MEGDNEMKSLDPLQARLFPTLAAYARDLRRREILAFIGVALSAYIIGRDLLSAYQGRIATENMLAVVTRVNELESQCQQAYPKKFTVSKSLAQVIVQRHADGKEREP